MGRRHFTRRLVHLAMLLSSVLFPIPFLPTSPYLLPYVRDSDAPASSTLQVRGGRREGKEGEGEEVGGGGRRREGEEEGGGGGGRGRRREGEEEGGEEEGGGGGGRGRRREGEEEGGGGGGRGRREGPCVTSFIFPFCSSSTAQN